VAQAIVTICKLAGRECLRRYSGSSLDRLTASELFQMLEAEEPGVNLLYKTVHFDPTTIATIDYLNDRFPDLFSRANARRLSGDGINLALLTIPVSTLQETIRNMKCPKSNVDEQNLLTYLMKAAVSFWRSLLIKHQLTSLVAVAVQVKCPSLLDDDFIKNCTG
jgi:hypothetical protein